MKRIANHPLLALSAVALLAAGACVPARAQDSDDMQRGVARISLMEGEVSVQRGDAGEWVAGVINAPLLTGDRISTGPNSRAEIQFDSANILRLGGNADIRLSLVEYGRYQIELAHGTATYRVLRPSTANVEVDTPSISVRPSKEGTFRMSVMASGESQITARAGDIEIFTPRGSQWLNAGQTMMARGTTADPEFQVGAAIPGDDWDRWNDARDRVLLRSTSYQYVGQDVYGAEDLDQYGSWVDVPNYGHVWRPVVGTDWAPYRAGRWVWLDWYGWTWVSYDPWGWAPYHYGRWFYESSWGWCWYPGVMRARHYWSPALVAWFGYGGGGIGVGFGFGNIGWVPLAPYEVLHPWWGRGYYGRGYFGHNVNITNVNITNVYRNARVRGGISGMGAGDFQGGHFGRIGRVSDGDVRTAGLVRGGMPIGPNSGSLRYSDRQASYAPRNQIQNQRFFTHQQVNAPQRVSFADQQRAFSGAGDRGNRVAEVNRGPAGDRGTAAGGFNRAQQSNAAPGAGNGGWRRFDEPSRANAGAPAGRADAAGAVRNDRPSRAPSQDARGAGGAGGNGGNTGGWQRFGSPDTTRTAPRSSAQEAPRSSGNSGGNGGGWSRFGDPGAQRQQAAPRRESAPQAAPQYNRPERQGGAQFNGGFGRQSAPQYRAPARESAPQQQYRAPGGGGPSRNTAPRSFGGGGGGGGGGSRPSGGGNSGGGGGAQRGGGGHGRR